VYNFDQNTNRRDHVGYLDANQMIIAFDLKGKDGRVCTIFTCFGVSSPDDRVIILEFQ
jgi:hypothetical protein